MSRIVDSGPAAKDGGLQIHDRIVEVRGRGQRPWGLAVGAAGSVSGCVGRGRGLCGAGAVCV